MFNFRPDTPWIHFRPEPEEDDPPGFRIAPDGSAMDTRSGAVGSEWSGYGPHVFGAPSAPVAYRPFETAIHPRSYPADSSFSLGPTPRSPLQEAFDQLARIYAGAGYSKRQASAVGTTAVDSNLGLQGSSIAPQLSNPWAAPASRVDSRFTPLSYGSPSIRAPLSQLVVGGAPLDSLTNSLVPRNTFLSDPDSRPSPLAAGPPAIAALPNAKDGEVLSDVASDDGLRDGQQYAQYRRPVSMRGVTAGLDEQGRSVLVPDTSVDGDRRDPLEKLRQRGYPQPPDDPTNGSATVKELREREQYDQHHHAGYHRYEFTDHLCNVRDAGCTPEAAYEALLRHAVPGGLAPGVPVTHGQESTVSLMGVPGGRIRTLVDGGSSSIINQTLPDHQFHNGFVQRQIVTKNGKIYVRTFGEGNNSTPEKAGWNRLLAKPAFQESTARIRAAIRPAAPIGKQ